MCDLHIDLDRSLVVCAGHSHKLKHHMAGLFLFLLWQAHHLGRALDKATLLQAWSEQKPGAKPDRTALLRVIHAVAGFVHEQTPPLQAQLVVKEHARTSGPWALRVAPDSFWNTPPSHVQARQEALDRLEDLPQLGTDPAAAHACAQLLCTTDALLTEGHYEDAAQLLSSQLPAGSSWPGHLTPDAAALLALRWLRVMRRLGRLQEAAEIRQQLQERIGSLSPVWARHVQAQCTLVGLRQVFDETPQRASVQLSLQGTPPALLRTVCPQSLAEWSNLRALTLRRQLIRLQADEHRHKLQQLTLAHAQAALFWSWVANDPWWQQATAVNLAYLLERLWQHRLPGGDVLLALQWYSLSNRLVDRFNFPPDSAWDFIMPGYLFRQAIEDGHISLADHSLSWPESADPRQSGFYERAVELAQRYGSVRQSIAALNLAAWFFGRQAAGKARQHQVRQQRDALIGMHPEIWQDMVLDGSVRD